MKRVFNLLIATTLVFFTLNSCDFTPDVVEEEIENCYKISDSQYDLSYGVIADYGTDYEITGRTYSITLKSANSDIPSNYVQFYMVSTSTTRLKEGTYTYGGTSAGSFNEVEFGYGLQYDQTFTAIEGKRVFADRYMKSGTIELSMVNGDYVFEFDFELNSTDSTYHVTGYFTDVLHEY